MAAIGYFGLLEETPNHLLRISKWGLDILLGDYSDPDRATAIREVAAIPELFTELSIQFPDNKASNRNLENYLIKNGFNPKAAARAVKAYRDTIDFVEEQTRGVTLDDPELQLGEITVENPAQVYRPPQSIPASDDYHQRYRIGSNKFVDVTGKEGLTEDELQVLIEHLELEMRMIKRERKSSSQDDTVDGEIVDE